jgi:type IX secretion system PorP/SprF family membrane protein
MFKFILNLATIFLFGFSVFAQPALTKYMENIGYFNPAALAYNPCDSLKITSFYRNQWIGINGSPQNFTAMAEYNLKKINSGIGINFNHERIGLFKNNEIGLSYRYSLNFKNQRTLSAGASMDIYNLRMKGLLIFGTNNTQEINSADTKITSRFGLFYSSKTLLLGVSLFHPFEPIFRLEFMNSTYQFSRLYNLHGSYKFYLDNNNSLSPELIVFANRQANFTLFNLKWNRLDKTVCGAGVKVLPGVQTNYASNVSFGYHAFDKFYFGAVCEYFFRNLSWKHALAAELMVRYELKKSSLDCKKS